MSKSQTLPYHNRNSDENEHLRFFRNLNVTGLHPGSSHTKKFLPSSERLFQGFLFFMSNGYK